MNPAQIQGTTEDHLHEIDHDKFIEQVWMRFHNWSLQDLRKEMTHIETFVTFNRNIPFRIQEGPRFALYIL